MEGNCEGHRRDGKISRTPKFPAKSSAERTRRYRERLKATRQQEILKAVKAGAGCKGSPPRIECEVQIKVEPEEYDEVVGESEEMVEPPTREEVARRCVKLKSFKCDFKGCGLSFPQKSELVSHVHNGEKPFECEYDGCSLGFPNEDALKRHAPFHTGDRSYECGFEGCGKRFVDERNLRQHAKVHNGRVYKCDFEDCDRSYVAKYDLDCHRRMHTGDKRFECSFEGCGRGFSNKLIYHRHLKTHSVDRPFKCTVTGCAQSFRRKFILERHVERHAQSHTCGFRGCGRVFKLKVSLRQHMLTHANDPEKETDGRCEADMKNDELEDNIEAGGESRDEVNQDAPKRVQPKRFKCEVAGCGFSAPKRTKLVIHMYQHTGERPFQCEYNVCDRKFTNKYALKRHLLFHTGNRPFECGFKGCGKNFVDEVDLRRHTRLHFSAKESKGGAVIYD